jgi:predicted ATPase/DNA-binding SARP family transcriptional activator
MNAAVELRVLGPLEVRQEGQVRTISSRTQRRLLTALTIAGGTTLSTDQLVGRLWGDEPPPAARNSLQSHVARLRALIGGDVIVTRQPGYALDLAQVEIDAARFERAVTTSRSQLPADPLGAAAVLIEALEEWRGVAHAEFADDLALTESARLANLRIDACQLLARAQRDSGDAEAAVDTLLGLVGEAPLREDVVVAAARALGELGRGTEALAILRAYRSRLGDELGLDPGSEVAVLEQQLLRGEVASGSGSADATPRPGAEPLATIGLEQHAPRSPPSVVTTTVGRDHDLEQLDRALHQARLVTLVGPGGVGKTRLATVVAHLRSRGEQRVAWVDLATVSTANDVPPFIAESLGIAVPDRMDLAATAAALARFRGTVILDNCEHLLEPVAKVVHLAVGQVGSSRLLATSRERLDVPGERVVLLGPLPVPDTDEATDTDPAVELFLERARAAGAASVTTAQAARVVAAVDGLPLAIELAAARAASLPVEEMLARLDRHLDILAATARRQDERHGALSNVIAWSYELLDPRERAVFRRLAVFASSFRLVDAEQVCSSVDLPPSDVVEAVARLVEASMITRVEAGRYRLLAPLRLFAATELGRDADGRVAFEQHRSFVLDLAERADADLTSPREAETIALLEGALPDMRAVYSRAVVQGDLATIARLAGRLYRFAYAQARGDLLAWGAAVVDKDVDGISEAERLRAIAASVPAETWNNDADEGLRRTRWYVGSLDDPDLDPWIGITLAETLADLLLVRGDLAGAVAANEQGVELARRLDHRGLLSYTMSGLSIAKTFAGELGDAERLAREAVALVEGAGVHTASSLAAYALGEALAAEDPDAALEAFASAIADAGRVNARFFEAIARTADVALRGRHGDPQEAFARYRSALRIWREAGADGMALTTLRNLVVLLARTGADADALVLHQALERFASRASYGHEADRLDAAIRAVTERLSPTARADAERVARSLDDLGAVFRFGIASIDRAAR